MTYYNFVIQIVPVLVIESCIGSLLYPFAIAFITVIGWFVCSFCLCVCLTFQHNKVLQTYLVYSLP